jgi:putative redox protein
MPSEKITFAGHDGARLAARLDRPEGPVRAAALFAHCFTCSKDIAAARSIAAGLAARGIAVLRFDFTGLGHSGGEFANTNFSSNVADIIAAADWMRDQGLPAQMLIGHSLGGAAVIAATPEIEGLRAVVTIGAPHAPDHVLANLGSSLDAILRDGTAQVSLAGRSFEIRRQFIEDVGAASLDTALRGLKAALLVLHGPRDATVGIDNAEAIFRAARHPKSFVSLDDADHLISDNADAEYAAGVIAAWAARYLDFAATPPDPSLPEGVTRVAEAGPDGLRQIISVAGKHVLAADEPERLGGTDTGPTPYQLLSAALGACTTMTLRMYARRKGMSLDHVACDVTHGRCHGEDCCDGAGRVDEFRRTIRLTGSLTQDERRRLLEIADKCPVHHTLQSRAVIRTALAED